MSETSVKEIIERAIEDEAFRKQLFADSETALKEYDLTEKERALLEGLTEENLNDFAGGLGDRTTKGAIRPGF